MQEAVSDEGAGGGVPASRRWAMVARGFFCQNVTIGCAFGGYGVSMLPLQEHFGVGRGVAALGLSLAMLMMGLMAPLAATAIGWFGLRRTMMAGALLSTCGYLTLAFAPSIYVALAAYALLVGVGIATTGPMPVGVLASNWSQPNPGRAVGIVNMPALIVILPPAGLVVIERYGLSSFYLMLAALSAAMILVVWGVRDGPAGRAPAAAPAAVPATAKDADEMLPARTLLSSPIYLTMAVGGGLLGAVSVIGVAHLLPFAVERGVPAGQATLLLSVMAAAGVVGSPVTGLLCDRLGGVRTLMLLSIALGTSWALLSATTLLPLMIIGSLILGMGGVGIFPAINVATGHLYGVPTLPRALGLYQFLSLPLTALLPPLAGILHDAAGGYGLVAALAVGSCLVMALVYFSLSRMVSRQRALQQLVPVSA